MLEHRLEEDADQANQPEDTPMLRSLYRSFEENHLLPLWTQRDDLMPVHPKPRAVPQVWKWSKLLRIVSSLSSQIVSIGQRGSKFVSTLLNSEASVVSNEKEIAFAIQQRT